jgi:hypothetical protein
MTVTEMRREADVKPSKARGIDLDIEVVVIHERALLRLKSQRRHGHVTPQNLARASQQLTASNNP